MFKPYHGQGPEPVGFLLLPGYSAMAFFSAIEPLRVANRLAARPLFRWRVYSADGAPVPASSGMRLVVDDPISAAAGIPTLIVCAGFEPERAATRMVLAGLNRLARTGTMLGALDTGAYVLARAKLLRGVRVTMHWEAVSGFREQFPDIVVTDELFEIGERIFTCAGGTASLDLMLDMIGRKHGAALAVAVSEQLIHDRIRIGHDQQRMKPALRFGTNNAKLLKIIDAMEAAIESPLALADLAGLAGITPRQMERLFGALLGNSPAAFYRRLRLERARQLLRQTDMSVIDVALATGFTTASALSRNYRAGFGRPPSADRHDPAAGMIIPAEAP